MKHYKNKDVIIVERYLFSLSDEKYNWKQLKFYIWYKFKYFSFVRFNLYIKGKGLLSASVFNSTYITLSLPLIGITH